MWLVKNGFLSSYIWLMDVYAYSTILKLTKDIDVHGFSNV